MAITAYYSINQIDMRGGDMMEYTCYKCGNVFDDKGQKFCPECGMKVGMSPTNSHKYKRTSKPKSDREQPTGTTQETPKPPEIKKEPSQKQEMSKPIQTPKQEVVRNDEKNKKPEVTTPLLDPAKIQARTEAEFEEEYIDDEATYTEDFMPDGDFAGGIDESVFDNGYEVPETEPENIEEEVETAAPEIQEDKKTDVPVRQETKATEPTQKTTENKKPVAHEPKTEEKSVQTNVQKYVPKKDNTEKPIKKEQKPEEPKEAKISKADKDAPVVKKEAKTEESSNETKKESSTSETSFIRKMFAIPEPMKLEPKQASTDFNEDGFYDDIESADVYDSTTVQKGTVIKIILWIILGAAFIYAMMYRVA